MDETGTAEPIDTDEGERRANEVRRTWRTAIGVSSDELFAWHLRPGAFERLLPPGDGTRVTGRTGTIESDTMQVTLSVPLVGRGPIRQRWVVRHEGYQPGRRFVDVMERGPFRHWRHEHRVEPLGPGEFELVDDIRFVLPIGVLGRVAGTPVVLGKLAPMFAWRHAVTAGDLLAHRDAALAPLTIEVRGARRHPLGTAVTALLMTGGHAVGSDVEIVGAPAAPAGPVDVRVDLTAAGATISRAEGHGATDVALGTDAAEGPRRVLAAIASLVQGSPPA